jgi:DNA-binding transcriptional LysR family regulator
MSSVALAALDGENYLDRINCEYEGAITGVCNTLGISVHDAYASEREDWIQNLIAGGLGVALVPEFTAVTPGIQLRPVSEPELWRDIKLLRFKNTQPSQAAMEFTAMVRDYPWPRSRFTPLSTAA